MMVIRIGGSLSCRYLLQPIILIIGPIARIYIAVISV